MRSEFSVEMVFKQRDRPDSLNLSIIIEIEGFLMLLSFQLPSPLYFVQQVGFLDLVFNTLPFF